MSKSGREVEIRRIYVIPIGSKVKVWILLRRVLWQQFAVETHSARYLSRLSPWRRTLGTAGVYIWDWPLIDY